MNRDDITASLMNSGSGIASMSPSVPLPSLGGAFQAAPTGQLASYGNFQPQNAMSIYTDPSQMRPMMSQIGSLANIGGSFGQ